jgi:hypothetical protein
MNGTCQKKMSLAAVTAILVGVTGAPGAGAQTVWGTYEQPLEGRRFETMRALAHYLDEAAQDALAAVVQARRRGTPADRRYITSVRDFARRAENLHTRMDEYDVSPFDVPDEVDYLAARARRVSQQIRQVSAYQPAYDDWNNVIEVLSRMRRLLNGEDVEVPPAHDEYGDYNRDYGYLGRGGAGHSDTGHYDTPADHRISGGIGTFGGSLNGSRLQQFRELAHQLDTSASRALQAAERSMPNNDRARGILSDLQHFAAQTRALHDRSDANAVDPREVGPIVNHLLEDAQLADRSMRAAGAFPDAWRDWEQAMDALNQMSSMVR